MGNGDNITCEKNISPNLTNNYKYLGDFTRDNPKVKFKVVDNTDFIPLKPIGGPHNYVVGSPDVSESYDYTEVSLLKIGGDNYKEIDSLLKKLHPKFSYAIIFLIRVRDTGEVVTLDRHMLVNNTNITFPPPCSTAGRGREIILFIAFMNGLQVATTK